MSGVDRIEASGYRYDFHALTIQKKRTASAVLVGEELRNGGVRELAPLAVLVTGLRPCASTPHSVLNYNGNTPTAYAIKWSIANAPTANAIPAVMNSALMRCHFRV